MEGSDWNEYYGHNDSPWTQPDPDLVAQTAGLIPGRALDLGSGEGANALWLASRGWDVVALDYAPAALATVRRLAAAQGLTVRTRVADATGVQLEPQFDLVCICYLHLVPPCRAAVLRVATSALLPGGTLLYLGMARGPGGDDSSREVLAVPHEIVEQLPGLIIERAGARFREVGCPEGSLEAEVIIVRARCPA